MATLTVHWQHQPFSTRPLAYVVAVTLQVPMQTAFTQAF